MYSSFIIIPQFAQLPTSTGFGFGVVGRACSGLYLLPLTIAMMADEPARRPARVPLRLAQVAAGRQRGHRRGVPAAAVAHGHRVRQMLIAAGLIGIGIGLAFAALGNLIVERRATPADRRRLRA